MSAGKDPRRALYDRYVSGFKSENLAISDEDLAHYYRWCDLRYRPALEGLSCDAEILELGCGHGRFLSYLRARSFANARGIDISEEQVELACERGLQAEAGDMFEALERIRPASLDLIVAIDVVEHLTLEELLHLGDLLVRALRKDGRLLLVTVNGEALFPRQIIYGDLTHCTIFTSGSMRQWLRSAGFTDIQSYELAPASTGIKGKVRTALWKLLRAAANAIRTIEAGKRQDIWSENFLTVVRKA